MVPYLATKKLFAKKKQKKTVLLCLSLSGRKQLAECPRDRVGVPQAVNRSSRGPPFMREQGSLRASSTLYKLYRSC